MNKDIVWQRMESKNLYKTLTDSFPPLNHILSLIRESENVRKCIAPYDLALARELLERILLHLYVFAHKLGLL